MGIENKNDVTDFKSPEKVSDKSTEIQELQKNLGNKLDNIDSLGSVFEDNKNYTGSRAEVHDSGKELGDKLNEEHTLCKNFDSNDIKGSSENLKLEKLENDKLTIKTMVNESKCLNQLTPEKQAALVNVTVELAAKGLDLELSTNELENVKGNVHFVKTKDIVEAKGLDKDQAKNILGYYSPNNGQIYINSDNGISVEESIVTIIHETLHCLSQHYDKEGNTDGSGLKQKYVDSGGNLEVNDNKIDIKYNCTGLNEGVTQMYAARIADVFFNPKEISDNNDDVKREEISYKDLVTTIRVYEGIIGEATLLEAYKSGNISALSIDMNNTLNPGAFEVFGKYLDQLHALYKNKINDSDEEKQIKSNIANLLNDYKNAKSETDNSDNQL